MADESLEGLTYRRAGAKGDQQVEPQDRWRPNRWYGYQRLNEQLAPKSSNR